MRLKYQVFCKKGGKETKWGQRKLWKKIFWYSWSLEALFLLRKLVISSISRLSLCLLFGCSKLDIPLKISPLEFSLFLSPPTIRRSFVSVEALEKLSDKRHLFQVYIKGSLLQGCLLMRIRKDLRRGLQRTYYHWAASISLSHILEQFWRRVERKESCSLLTLEGRKKLENLWFTPRISELIMHPNDSLWLCCWAQTLALLSRDWILAAKTSRN